MIFTFAKIFAFGDVTMKKALLYLLMFAVALQAFRHLGIVVSFKINQDYIAKNLCEKRDEPESCCKGSCYLEKELKKAAETEEKAPVPVQKLELVWFFENTAPVFYGMDGVREHNSCSWFVNIKRRQWRLEAPFRPPAV